MRNSVSALDDRGALSPGVIDISLAKFKVVGNIRPCLGKDETSHYIFAKVRMKYRRFGADTELGVEDWRQNFIIDIDQVERLLRDLLADRSHSCDRIAHVAHAITAEDVAI